MKPVLALLPISLLLACSPKSETPASVTIADAWCRPTPAGALAGACYLTLTESADDRLTAVETPLRTSASIDVTSAPTRLSRSPSLCRSKKSWEMDTIFIGYAPFIRSGARIAAGPYRWAIFYALRHPVAHGG